jgi:tetratricopeptide (TPR) repeat protein
MLETVRRDATQRLVASEKAEVRRRHGHAYLAFARAMWPALEAFGLAALVRMAEERDNLRAAVRYAVEAADAGLGLALAQPLGMFYWLSGDMDEAAATIDAVLAIPGGEEPSLARMRALEAAANTAYYAGDREVPRRLYRAQLEMARTLGDAKGIADARWNLFFTEFGPNDWDPAFRELDSIEAAYRELGDERALARTLTARANWLVSAGRREEAVQVLKPAIERYRALHDISYRAQSAQLLTAVCLELGDPAAGAQWLMETFDVADEAGSTPTVMIGLPMMALTIHRLGMPEEAATILGAYEGFTRRYGIRMPAFLAQLMASRFDVSEIREALPPATYEAARTRGDGMEMSEVIAFARRMVAERSVLTPT